MSRCRLEIFSRGLPLWRNLANVLTSARVALEFPLMTLPTYKPERRLEVAAQLGIEEQYLYQLGRNLAIASPTLARRWNALDPDATLQDLRPNDWQAIWPELIVADPEVKTA